MINHILLNFVNQELGIGKPTSRGNYAYHCPFCNHRKPKLEIQMNESSDGVNGWHCWSCDVKGKRIHQLFMKLRITSERMSLLNEIVKSTKSYENNDSEFKDSNKISLPKEFKSLKEPNLNDIETRHALYYLKKRGIKYEDIIKYDIGFCEGGKYNGKIIFPIYDKNGELVFFDSRTYKDESLRYLKPSFSKNFIANDHLINWDLPVILCEGIFDAIAIKRNVIPLLGKTIQPELMKKILTSNSNKIYIVLDSDALKKAVEFCELLMNEGKEVYLVEMGEDDASKMGFEKFTRHIQKTKKLNYSKLLETKINM